MSVGLVRDGVQGLYGAMLAWRARLGGDSAPEYFPEIRERIVRSRSTRRRERPPHVVLLAIGDHILHLIRANASIQAHQVPHDRVVELHVGGGRKPLDPVAAAQDPPLGGPARDRLR